MATLHHVDGRRESLAGADRRPTDGAAVAAAWTRRLADLHAELPASGPGFVSVVRDDGVCLAAMPGGHLALFDLNDPDPGHALAGADRDEAIRLWRLLIDGGDPAAAAAWTRRSLPG